MCCIKTEADDATPRVPGGNRMARTATRRIYDRAVICELRRQGMTYPAIASQVGCSHALIARALKENGFCLRPYQRHVPNFHWRQIASRELETEIALAKQERLSARIYKLPATETFRPRSKT